VAQQKPLTLVFDPVRGGASLEVIQSHECPDDLRAPIFDGREVIHWHRIKVYPAALATVRVFMLPSHHPRLFWPCSAHRISS